MFHTQDNQKKEKLLKKNAGTDIIDHGEYHSEENGWGFFSSFSSLGWITMML